MGQRKRTVMSRNRRKVECPEMGREIDKQRGRGKDMSNKKILYVVEAIREAAAA